MRNFPSKVETAQKKRHQLAFRALRALSLVCLAAGMSGVVQAGTASSDIVVTALVVNTCTITAGPLTFGVYDPVAANAVNALTGTALLTVACTNAAAATITIGQGSNADSGSTDASPLRRMKFSSDYLNYNMYSDTGRTVLWGNTAGTGVAYTGTGLPAVLTVYGKLSPAQTSAHAGLYTDTAVATITF